MCALTHIKVYEPEQAFISAQVPCGDLFVTDVKTLNDKSFTKVWGKLFQAKHINA